MYSSWTENCAKWRTSVGKNCSYGDFVLYPIHWLHDRGRSHIMCQSLIGRELLQLDPTWKSHAGLLLNEPSPWFPTMMYAWCSPCRGLEVCHSLGLHELLWGCPRLTHRPSSRWHEIAPTPFNDGVCANVARFKRYHACLLTILMLELNTLMYIGSMIHKTSLTHMLKQTFKSVCLYFSSLEIDHLENEGNAMKPQIGVHEGRNTLHRNLDFSLKCGHAQMEGRHQVVL